MLWAGWELRKDTVLHVRWWFLEHIMRFTDWLLGLVHVMRWHWLVTQWRVEQFSTWLMHDQCMYTMWKQGGIQPIKDYHFHGNLRLEMYTVHLQLLIVANYIYFNLLHMDIQRSCQDWWHIRICTFQMVIASWKNQSFVLSIFIIIRTDTEKVLLDLIVAFLCLLVCM